MSKEDFVSTTALPAEGRCDHPVAELIERLRDGYYTKEDATDAADLIVELMDELRKASHGDSCLCSECFNASSPTSGDREEDETIGRGTKYFAINDRTMGVSTSFRVSGRLGEMGKRHPLLADAQEDCRRLNRAYELGLKHGLALFEASPTTSGERNAPAPRNTSVEPK
jgi:hypothetical protein